MPRTARRAPKGLVYHALNRAVARLPLFSKQADYQAFEAVLAEAHERFPLAIMAYCVMPNHWHFVLRGDKRERREWHEVKALVVVASVLREVCFAALSLDRTPSGDVCEPAARDGRGVEARVPNLAGLDRTERAVATASRP